MMKDVSGAHQVPKGRVNRRTTGSRPALKMSQPTMIRLKILAKGLMVAIILTTAAVGVHLGWRTLWSSRQLQVRHVEIIRSSPFYLSFNDTKPTKARMMEAIQNRTMIFGSGHPTNSK